MSSGCVLLIPRPVVVLGEVGDEELDWKNRRKNDPRRYVGRVIRPVRGGPGWDMMVGIRW